MSINICLPLHNSYLLMKDIKLVDGSIATTHLWQRFFAGTDLTWIQEKSRNHDTLDFFEAKNMVPIFYQQLEYDASLETCRKQCVSKSVKSERIIDWSVSDPFITSSDPKNTQCWSMRVLKKSGKTIWVFPKIRVPLFLETPISIQ